MHIQIAFQPAYCHTLSEKLSSVAIVVQLPHVYCEVKSEVMFVSCIFMELLLVLAFFSVKIKSARESHFRPFLTFFTEREVAFTQTFSNIFTGSHSFHKRIFGFFHGWIFFFTGRE